MPESTSSHWKMLAVSLSILVVFTGLSSPSGVVVSDTGEVRGIHNKFRAAVQGQSFWKDQAIEVEKKIASVQSFLKPDPELARLLAKVESDSNRELEAYYLANPELRPTRADLLREEADRIEAAEGKRRLDEMFLEQLGELERIKAQVVARTG